MTAEWDAGEHEIIIIINNNNYYNRESVRTEYFKLLLGLSVLLSQLNRKSCLYTENILTLGNFFFFFCAYNSELRAKHG